MQFLPQKCVQEKCPFFLLADRWGEPLAGGGAPRGVESGKTARRAVLREGGQHAPPAEGEKPRRARFRGPLAGPGGRAKRGDVPPSGGTV